MAVDKLLQHKKQQSGKPAGKWVTARKIAQGLALLVFLALFIASRREGWPISLVNLPMRLDPLLMLAHLLSSRQFLAGSAAAFTVIALSLVFGRAWCGWLCPLGTLLDLFSLSRWRTSWNTGNRRYDEKDSSRQAVSPARSLKHGLFFLILFAAIFGNLTLVFLDPLTIFFRTLTTAIWPALDQIILGLETVLYPLPGFAEPVSAFDTWIRPNLFPIEPGYYRQTLLFAGFLIVLVLLNLAAERFWCRYLCPLGGLLGLISKLSLFRRQVGDNCQSCTICTRVCPTGTINPLKGYASDPAECTLCMNCLEACPRNGIRLTPIPRLAEWNNYDPGRRQVLTTLVTSAAAVALLKSDAHAHHNTPFEIRPPGTQDGNFLSRCIRCGECMRVCPTGALQPAILESGWEGFWSPIVIPRNGYCDYSCNACGRICPVQAIPSLSLEEKRSQVIGKAVIDQNRCIPWSEQRDCIVCEEMCPVPEKAVRLERKPIISADGTPVEVQLPHVDRDMCIGCGICEYKCPVSGEAAIRVYPSASAVLF